MRARRSRSLREGICSLRPETSLLSRGAGTLHTYCVLPKGDKWVQIGIKCVSVFSDADSNSLHVKKADEAIYIGKSQAQQSYLVKEKIIDAAKATNCQAIHPGYGFLSESYEFSELCTKNDLIFIGAPWKAIR